MITTVVAPFCSVSSAILRYRTNTSLTVASSQIASKWRIHHGGHDDFHNSGGTKSQQWRTRLTFRPRRNHGTKQSLSFLFFKRAFSTHSRRNYKPGLKREDSQSDSELREEEQLVHAAAVKGRRSYMEDEHLAIQHSTIGEHDEGSSILAAVFDGHGGVEVSRFLKNNLYNTLLQQAPSGSADSSLSQLHIDRSVEDCIGMVTESLKQIDELILERGDWNGVGSTALVAWHYSPKKVDSDDDDDGANRVVILANVGDSRAVLGRVVAFVRGNQEKSKKKTVVVTLTRDHKPDEPEERRRIEMHGGKVAFSWDDVPRINGLSLSRAIGDAAYRPYVSAEPEMRVCSVGANSDVGINKDEEQVVEIELEFLILATDGLWEVMSPNEAVTMVVSLLQAKKDVPRKDIPFALVREAFRLGSSDNITVAIIWLKSLKK